MSDLHDTNSEGGGITGMVRAPVYYSGEKVYIDDRPGVVRDVWLSGSISVIDDRDHYYMLSPGMIEKRIKRRK